MKIAVVTGASSGIGKEFVKQIARRYKTIEEIWVIARREDKLNELKINIPNKHIRVLPLDLTKDSDIETYKNTLEKEQPDVRILVNASGFGKIGKFADHDIADSVGMINLNCTSLVKISYLTIPYMNYPSNIIQMASSAAFLPQPSFAIYAATKSFVLSFSRALNSELESKGITVTAICPGPVKTEFFDIAETESSIKMYKRLFMARADKVVYKALKDVNIGKTVSVYGVLMNGFRFISKLLPHGIMIKFVK